MAGSNAPTKPAPHPLLKKSEIEQMPERPINIH